MIRPRPASYGGVEFDVTDWEDSIDKLVERNRPVNKQGANLRNRGREAREVRCQIIFWNRTPIQGEQASSALDFRQRFNLFIVKALGDRVESFVHPMEGGFRALTEGLVIRGQATASDAIFVECTFVEDSTDASPFVTGAQRPQSAGLQDASAEAATTKTEFEAIGEDTSFLDDVNSTLDKWRDPDVSQDVAKDLGKLTRTIEEVQKTADLASDPNSYAAFRSTERLLYRLRLAAESVRSNEPQVREVTVRRGQPLRLFIAGNLSADNVEELQAQILELNTIRDPGFVRAGTTLRVPAVESGEPDYVAGASR